MTQENSAPRLWGGRFAVGPSDALTALSRSVQYDWRLAPYDLMQTKAHAVVLQRAGVLTSDDTKAILDEIAKLSYEVTAGSVQPIEADEDVHSALERILGE